MVSAIVKRSVALSGHKTSVTLEDVFWHALRDIASARHTSLSSLIDEIDLNRRHANLSSQIRTFVLDYYRRQIPHANAPGNKASAAS